MEKQEDSGRGALMRPQCGLRVSSFPLLPAVAYGALSAKQVSDSDRASALVQAAGEYLDHVRRAHSWETRLNRTLIRPEPLKHRALALVREITAA
jgi:hypothetical protein